MLAYAFFAKEKDALTSWTCLPQTLELIKSVTPISFPAGMDSVNIISEKLRVFFLFERKRYCQLWSQNFSDKMSCLYQLHPRFLPCPNCHILVQNEMHIPLKITPGPEYIQKFSLDGQFNPI
jgi:hypothetical protein